MAKKLKFIERKEEPLDAGSSKGGKKSSALAGFLRFIDRILFKNPTITFSFLILVVALPVSLYLTLREEGVSITSLAEQASLELTASNIELLNVNSQIDLKFEASGKNISEIKYIEIDSPEWLSSSTDSGSQTFRIKHYTGEVPQDVSDKFSLIARATKSSFDESCNGCDKDSKYIYRLSEFNATSSECDVNSIWARNPLGKNTSKSESSCEEFVSSCIAPYSWKSFDSLDICKLSDHNPNLLTTLDDIVATFDLDCDGNLQEESFSLDEMVEVQDEDGDVVRFEVESPGDFIKVTQDSKETIIKDVASSHGTSYSDYTYSAILEGDISSEQIGVTLPIRLNACDVLGNCTVEAFEISAMQRSDCSFTLPETGVVSVDIKYPTLDTEYKGINNIWWLMSGSGKYNVKVNLYNSNCKDGEKEIADFRNLTLGDNKGYYASFDSRAIADGDYCVGVLVSDNYPVNGDNYDKADFVKFEVRNDNLPPVITSTPGKTNILTNESFSYKVEATDPDNDSLTYDVYGLPNWLKFENNEISGSTTTPGAYTFAVFVEDGHTGYDSQNVTVNVSPPKNEPSQIKLLFPEENSVLAGTNNTIKWEASDAEGISKIDIYYSSDRKNWHLIGSYGEGTTQANWDVSGLENGIYYLKIIVIDNSDLKIGNSIVSAPFYVANEEDSEDEGQVEGEDTSMPSVNNMTPEPESETESKQPLISASLHPSNNAEVLPSKVKVVLDDEDISSLCQITESEVICQLEEDLEIGRHKVAIYFEDSKGKSITEEWYFEIIEVTQEDTNEDETNQEVESDRVNIPLLNKEVSKSALTVSLVLCCGALLLIAIPWIAYFLWSKRSEKTEGKQEQTPPQPEVPSGPSQGDTLEASGFYTRRGDVQEGADQSSTVYRQPEPVQTAQGLETQSTEPEVNSVVTEQDSVPLGAATQPPQTTDVSEAAKPYDGTGNND